MPTGTPLATATVPAYAISSDWTIFHASLKDRQLAAGTYAVVLGQATPMSAHYEGGQYCDEPECRRLRQMERLVVDQRVGFGQGMVEALVRPDRTKYRRRSLSDQWLWIWQQFW